MSSVDILAAADPVDEFARRTFRFDADPTEVVQKLRELPDDTIVEPLIEHQRLQSLPPLDLMLGARGSPGACGTGMLMDVFAHWRGIPLSNAKVTACFRGPPGSPSRSFDVYTSSSGHASVNFDDRIWHLAALIVAPFAFHWPVLVRGPSGKSIDVPCAPLPSIGWWHDEMGVPAASTGGGGVRVGVIDTGCGPHPDLAHVQDVGAFLSGNHLPGAGADIDVHGTHVCGSISSRPMTNSHPFWRYSGLSPNVEMFSARVFTDAVSGASQDDIVAAIDALSIDSKVDLINLSLGAALASEIERDAILDALDRGTLCVCAAGNSAPQAPQVLFPAAFDECVAVSAVGLDGWAPAGTLSASRLPSQSDFFGQKGLYLANFSCYGGKISVTAPGVGVIAPVPDRLGFSHSYAVMDGTSMASPMACAALAVALSGDAAYLAEPRTRVRAEAARQLLIGRARNVGLAS